MKSLVKLVPSWSVWCAVPRVDFRPRSIAPKLTTERDGLVRHMPQPAPLAHSVWAAMIAACFCMMHLAAQAQTVPSAYRSGWTVSVGAAATGGTLQYGDERLWGVSAFVDVENLHNLGFEGEARWLVFDQTNQEHATTYLIGPTYSIQRGRFRLYGKGLVGLGQFNYPYNLGTDNDFVYAPGGGVDFRVSHRISLRAADFEYQIWPQFHYGQMSSAQLSAGIRVRIF